MDDLKVARCYAWALFQLAVEQKHSESVFADIKNLQQILKESVEFQWFILNPVLSKEEKNSLLTAVFAGRVQPLTMTFFLFLVQKSRLGFLGNILKSYVELYLEATETIPVTISTAQPMDEALLNTLILKLQKRSNKKVMAQCVVDPHLLGGFKIRMEDQVYDASLGAQLKRYHKEVLSSV